MKKYKETAYDMRHEVISLDVFIDEDFTQYFTVGEDGVLEIQFSAGTSGHEYNVIYKHRVLQFRGCRFKAKWSRS